jgi:hypothetical protein
MSSGRLKRKAFEPTDVAVRAAVQDLREVRDAYRTVEILLDIPTPAEVPALMVERDRLAGLMRLINSRFDADLARAETAVRAV